MEKFTGGSVAVICSSILHTGSISINKLKSAVNMLYRLNDALRIQIIEDVDGTEQTVKEYLEQDFEVLTFKCVDDFTNYAENYAKEPIDIYGSLCYMKIVLVENNYGILVKLHHIIGDAWTMSILAKQFNALLNEEVPETYSYTDYLEAEGTYIKSKKYLKDRAFFVEQFCKCDEVIYLSDKVSGNYRASRKTITLSKEVTKQITDVVQNNNSSLFAVMMTLFGTYFSRVKMNAEKFYIGTPVLNRTGIKEQNTAGMFINTVPLLIELENEKTFLENLQTTTDKIISLLRHQHYNYEDLLSEIRKKYNFTEKLYDVVLSYQNAKTEVKEFQSKWYSNGMQTESLQIHIDDRDNTGTLRINYDYQTDIFTESEIECMHEHIFNLFGDAVKNEHKKVYELNILSDEEKNKLLYEFNDTKADYSKDKCVHELFEEQVAKTPDKTAVIASDQTLTYDQLDKLSNRIANGLIEKGVRKGDIVAFALPRKSYLVATMLGILKSGAAYMPIDPNYPQDRINYMVSNSQAKIFITEESIFFLTNNQNSSRPDISVSSENLCYCIYTSGSTGTPKGVCINHLNVENFVCSNIKNHFQTCLLSHCDYVVALNSIAFDITLQEILLPLLNAKTVILVSQEESIDIDSFISKFKGKNCGLILTPTKLQMYMQSKIFCDNMNCFSVIMCGAESFPDYLLREIKKYSSSIIYNGYGPTETTCGVLYSRVELENNINLGKPIANTQIYILDKYMRPTHIGITGELCIAGDGVGAGYLNEPELTAEKFIDNPFGEGKLYKTGDLAYWREDGNIMFVGRNDFQVKIRGLRIELGEIESAICSVDGVSQAVVVVRKNESGRQFICAFYTEETAVDVADIKKSILNKLPKYMLPHIFTCVNEIPVTPSGKINRKVLPEVDLENISNDTKYIKPQTPLQQEIARLMEQVLRHEPMGLDDDFFDCGGDSLAAIELASKAHSKGIYFNLQAIFDKPTVRKLCEHINNDDKKKIIYDETQFAGVNAILEKNTIDNISLPQKSISVGNVLIAGATGYLGIHLLSDFLDNDNGIAYCLIRGEDNTQSKNRLKELLRFYFDDKYLDFLDKRIKVLCADLTKEKFGLSNDNYVTLTQNVSTVINAAASVNHYGSYEYFYETNVRSVKHLIDFCFKSSAKLIHISTLSVSGNSFGDEFDGYISETEKHFSESNLYIGQPLENVYARSKFEAEKEVLLSMENGLKANIMRMGNLTNRLSDGKFQKNHESNAFLKHIKAMIELGSFPDYLLPLYVEFTPIDEAANAVMTITRNFSEEQTVFHINSTKVVYFSRLLKYLCELNVPVEIVDGTAFAQLLRNIAMQERTAHVFEVFINEMDENEHLVYDSNIRINNDFTVEYLRKLGFVWSDIEIEYIEKYINYFREIGFFPNKE